MYILEYLPVKLLLNMVFHSAVKAEGCTIDELSTLDNSTSTLNLKECEFRVRWPKKQRQIVCLCWPTFQVSPRDTAQRRRNMQRQVLYFSWKWQQIISHLRDDWSSQENCTVVQSLLKSIFFTTLTPPSILALSFVFCLSYDKNNCRKADLLSEVFTSFFKVLKKVRFYLTRICFSS